MNVDVVLVPVGRVSGEHDCVVSRSVCYKVRTAVCDVVGGFTVVVGFGGRIIYADAELTALGCVVSSGQRSEDGVAEHCLEV